MARTQERERLEIRREREEDLRHFVNSGYKRLAISANENDVYRLLQGLFRVFRDCSETIARDRKVPDDSDHFDWIIQQGTRLVFRGCVKYDALFDKDEKIMNSKLFDLRGSLLFQKKDKPRTIILSK